MFQDIGTLLSMDAGLSVSVFGLGSLVLYVTLRLRLRVKWMQDLDQTIAARRLLDQTTMTDVPEAAAADQAAADHAEGGDADDEGLEGAVGGVTVESGSPAVLPTAPTGEEEFGTPRGTSTPGKPRHSRRKANEAPEYKGFD